MGLFNLFKKDKKKAEQKAPATTATPEIKKEEPVTPPPAKEEPKAELKTEPKKEVQTEPAKEPAKEPVKAPAKPATKAEPKPATAKAPAEKASAKPADKPVAKAPAKTAEKAPAKPATKAEPKPATAKNATAKAPIKTTSQPFFVKTEDDVRVAFDEAIAAADAEIAKNGAKAVGKYEFMLEVDGYHFYLVANNGQVLFDSPSFTTLVGALKGIETFKKTVANTEFAIKKDKYNRFRFILANKYYGENYDSKDQCQKCAESVKKFVNNAKIIRYQPDAEAVSAYETAKSAKRTPDSINWEQIAKAEASATKMGKFEISAEEGGEYSFYLLANNGQVLYSSRYYASETACRKGVDSFKRAAYVGNFFVDRDKFGNYRYVLKNIGSAPSFIGESYKDKAQCEKVIDSVKNFIVTASVEVVDANN